MRFLDNSCDEAHWLTHIRTRIAIFRQCVISIYLYHLQTATIVYTQANIDIHICILVLSQYLQYLYNILQYSLLACISRYLRSWYIYSIYEYSSFIYPIPLVCILHHYYASQYTIVLQHGQCQCLCITYYSFTYSGLTQYLSAGLRQQSSHPPF